MKIASVGAASQKNIDVCCLTRGCEPTKGMLSRLG